MSKPSSTTATESVELPAESPGGPEQTTPTPTAPDPLLEILAAVRGIGARLDILEHRFEYLDRDVLKALDSASKPVPAELLDAPDADRNRELPAPFALRSDGVVLLSTAGLKPSTLAARERWEGVVLREDEVFDALDHIDDAIVDAAAHAGGRLATKQKDCGHE